LKREREREREVGVGENVLKIIIDIIVHQASALRMYFPDV
jgi:hypothetical protein